MPYSISSISPLSIACMGNDKTVIFAADELQRCLSKMIDREVALELKPSLELSEDAITVGISSALPFLDIPQVDDPSMDDAIFIDVKDGIGYISGNNPRSVLIAVYRYLQEIGCRWVRPGIDGEYIPHADVIMDVFVREAASYRHRGVCIEGAVGYEHVYDMIDWIPKLGFNAYFIQFKNAYPFFSRWYDHQGNPLMGGYKITQDDANKFVKDAVREIKKRGLLYHAVGHGWTCEALGIPCYGWDEESQPIPPEAIQYMAQIDGKRGLWHNVPVNTNLCYSNPKARDLITDAITKYLEENPSVDILHFWLADGSNNNCECEECAKARPSDFYVKMLNELDDKLTARNIDTKIVFLIYVDLLWPPESERFNNKDRFILMFAPITRTYSESFKPSDTLPEIPPYNRNKLQFPKNVDMNVAFLMAWKSIFDGDSFDFDYHLMWDHLNDPGHMQISDIISQDMMGLKFIDLNGYVSCQIQRVFLPTGLPMTVMGKTLWDASISRNDITDDYFRNAFGDDSYACKDYLTRLSELFDPVYMRGEKPIDDPAAESRYTEAIALIADFLPLIESNRKSGNICQRKSWEYLWYHAAIYRRLAEALIARAKGDKSIANSIWMDVQQMVREYEPIIHPVFDGLLFQTVMGKRFEL